VATGAKWQQVSTAGALQDVRYPQIDWNTSAINRDGVIVYGDVCVFRQDLDLWIDADDNLQKTLADREFHGQDWSLGNVVSWIAFRDPTLIC
jgi:hypothetical protein